MLFFKLGLSMALPLLILVLAGYWLLTAAQSSDPYSPHTLVETPFTTEVSQDGQINVISHFAPTLYRDSVSRSLALARTGFRIPYYSVRQHESVLSGNEVEIIDQIHQRRFNPDKPYVITGSHYSDLYMRNMGIFFNALLDPRLPTSDQDWQNRQRIALQTIAYDLAFLKANQGVAVTTIAPVGNRGFAGLNIYTEPSDSVFAVLYSLKALQDPEFVVGRFPSTATVSAKPLQTTAAAQHLMQDNRETLTAAINHYLDTALDTETHLIKQSIHLSSARDGIKRQSSFYDNVIAWATVQLADELGIPHRETLSRDEWRQKILQTYWDDSLGIFKNDVATAETIFSGDSLIVTSTDFFDLKNEGDKNKLERMISYIRTHSLDQPFPLKYSRSNATNNMHWAVKYFAPSYMGEGIWSHWGMEYIKALLMLDTAENDFGEVAQAHLGAYRANIEKFGGYPELYDGNGEAFNSGMVRGVLHTGWVVNYEQAKMLGTITLAPLPVPN